MGITVAELVEIASLGTRLLAGAGGGDRPISWAHVCELAAPWEWLGDGDLVMTTGLGIPEPAAAQEEYVVRLAEAGVVGVAIGENMSAPPLSPRMMRAADARGFPLLMTRYEVPFTLMARIVSAENSAEDQNRLSHALRIFEHLQLLVAQGGEKQLLGKLGDEVRCRLHLIEARSGQPVGEGSTPLPEALGEALLAQPLDPRGRRPAVLRLPESRGALVMPVPGPRGLLLIARPDGDERPDLTLLHHVVTVVSLEQVTVVADRERSRRLGASLLAQIIDGRIDPGAASEEVKNRGFDSSTVVVASSGDDGSEQWTHLHHTFDDAGVPQLLLTRGGTTLALLPDEEEALRRLVEAVPVGSHSGVSEPFESISGVPEAARQARWSLRQAEARDEPICRYSDEEGISPFLPGSLEGSRAAALQVLGSLLAYDEQHRSTLLLSLRVFLEENRSWQRAASRLHVHKQTLVYRMDRVEQLTGRRLSSTADVAELWLALEAGMASGAIPT